MSWQALGWAFAGAQCVVFVVVLVSFVRNWRATEFEPGDSLFTKAVKTTRNSATMLFAYVQLFAGGLINAVTVIAQALGDPTVVAIMQQYFDPKLVGAVLMVCALVTVWARNRTLEKLQ